MNIELQGVSARHPAARAGHAPALRSLDLQIASGEQVAVIGPSGAGTTTLLQVMACALPPASGHLQLDGRDPWTLPRSALQRQRGQLFLAPQVPPLPPRQRVVTSVLAARLPAMGLAASLRSLFYPNDIPAAFDALDHFDLADKLFERVDRLSGGERQRVGLARALLAPAKVWLIDEPLSALDPTRSKQAVATLLDGARERGVTLVATLHQVDVALAHFPRIVGLRDGQLAFDLPAAEVTQERLARLYDQFEHELRGEVPVVLAGETLAAQPAVMHCR
ncbi:phosphonate ABC transporter ATP-binding protein [Hydrogenophaga sp.]|uniref:phosphonate ABC transporter ATP-binding protein n=1 Tax=Hydrogenophaga sp. TaxID=1904254 RepID=UPI00273024C8|nr:ATP-binding cassette domain-containing protein [Hydrogenophaga sp.]MDP2018016.1 ATP-binding cassette domain-containing protein [Hydrogenophaga sp.]